MTGPAIISFLRRHGLCLEEPSRLERLPGGVSSDAWLAECTAGTYVVKHARRRFRVAQDWRVDPRRLRVEYQFARLLYDRLGPSNVAEPLAYNAVSHMLALAYVPPPFGAWKGRLLRGLVEPSVAQGAAKLLARIHRLGIEEPNLRPSFRHPRLFEQQRLGPYFHAAARRHPDVGPTLKAIAEELRADDTTLIHGDFSPKNLLTDGQRVVLIDHEVATWGNPDFDVAFVSSHLLLKAVRRPDRRPALTRLADAFVRAYAQSDGPAELRVGFCRLVAALLLARVDGKSPVEYLTPRQQDAVRRRALTLMRDPPSGPAELFKAWSKAS